MNGENWKRWIGIWDLVYVFFLPLVLYYSRPKKKVYVIYEFFLLPGPVQAFQPVQPESSVNIWKSTALFLFFKVEWDLLSTQSVQRRWKR
jgi:hypothetical protein